MECSSSILVMQCDASHIYSPDPRVGHQDISWSSIKTHPWEGLFHLFFQRVPWNFCWTPPWWCGASHHLEPFKRPPLSLESWWWTARCVWNIWIHQPLLHSQSRNSTKCWCSDDDHGEGGEKFVDEWFSPLGKPAKLINIIVMFRWVVRKFHAYIPYYIPI